MPDYSDTLGVHIDSAAGEASTFSLVMEKGGWTATAKRKHARKETTATGATPLEAAANLLVALRGEPEEAAPADADETTGFQISGNVVTGDTPGIVIDGAPRPDEKPSKG